MLQMQGVIKRFGAHCALGGFSMAVPRGAVYGLIGPNGAGKSTAIRVLSGAYRPDAGVVQVDGQPVFENPTVKSRMCTIADEVFFFSTATLRDMCSFYRQMYPGFDERLYEQLNAAFQLPAKMPMRRFSKGMQKQAAFQLSLCTRPEILILDEPVDGLDPVVRRQVWSLILSDVAQQGTTVLISSHNLRELEDVCDHVGIVNQGKMLLERSLAEMQENTVKLQLMGRLPQGIPMLHQSEAGRLTTYIVRGSAEEITRRVQMESPAYFQVLPLSLEEIFVYELGGIDHEVKSILL